MSAIYEVVFIDHHGMKFKPPIENLRFYRVVNSVGSCTINIQEGQISDNYLDRDTLIEIWRNDENGSTRLVTDTIWLLRKTSQSENNKKRQVSILAYDLNYILANPIGNTGRIVPYYAATAETEKNTLAADDMIKAIVRENLGVASTDYDGIVTRPMPFLEVAPDSSQAPAISKSFAWRNVASVLKEICQSSRDAGIYLAYDFVITIPPHEPFIIAWPAIPIAGADFKIVFRTFINQRGTDHAISSGNPIRFGPAYGNINNALLIKDYENETNYIYAAGQGISINRKVRHADGFSNLIRHPYVWNRRESFVNALATEVAATIQDEANSGLSAGLPKMQFSGDLVSIPSSRYGIDWNWGDKITVEFAGHVFDSWIEGLTVYWSRDEGETITASIKAEEEL